MRDNDVWDFVPLSESMKFIGCKWIFKAKRYLKDNVKGYKACLAIKSFTQKKGIDYKETYFSISLKDSFRTIITPIAHFNLELHQIDVKTAFLNTNIDKTIYMVKHKNFILGDSKQMVYELKKSISGLK